MIEEEFNQIKKTEKALFPLFLKISNNESVGEQDIEEAIVIINDLEKKLRSPRAIEYLNIMKLGLTDILLNQERI